MGRSPGDEMILSYNDTVLRRSDLEILSGPYLLNDRIIEFYFSYLSSIYPSDEIFLVPPSIAFWLQNCSDEETLNCFAEPLNLPSKNLVIFPVNNNKNPEIAEGGSHWSLLAFYRSANKFIHHDSIEGSNNSYSKRLYASVVQFMGTSDSVEHIEYKPSPQQQNGYDCGLFVITTARVICDWYKSGGQADATSLWFYAVKEHVTPSNVSDMRLKILGLIKELMDRK